MNKSSSNCLRCGAPMNPPRSGHYNCEFCGASYFAGGIFSRSIYYLKRVTETQGFNSSVIIPVGFGSLILAFLIFRYPTFQNSRVQNTQTSKSSPNPKTPPTQKIIINQPTFDQKVIEESIKKTINETINSIPGLLEKESSQSQTYESNKPVITMPQKPSNKSASNNLKTVYRKETNSIPFKLRIAATIGFRPSIKTVTFVSRRSSTKDIKQNDKANFYYERGLEKKVLGDYQGALIDYSKAIQLNPNDPDFYYARGWLRAKSEVRDLVGAASDFIKVNRLEPNNVQNLLDLASVYTRALYPNDTKRALDIAQQIEPNNGNIVWWRGVFIIKNGKTPIGCKYVRQARRMKASDYDPTLLKDCN